MASTLAHRFYATTLVPSLEGLPNGVHPKSGDMDRACSIRAFSPITAAGAGGPGSTSGEKGSGE